MKKAVNKKFITIIYVSLITFCVSLLTLLLVFTIIRVCKNAQLKKEADAIVERYRTEASQHNNKKDPDYAEIFFDNNVVYIPNEDIVMECHP